MFFVSGDGCIMLRCYFSAPNSAPSAHRMGFLIYGDSIRDLRHQSSRRGFSCLDEFEFVFLLLDFGIKKLRIVFGWAVCGT